VPGRRRLLLGLVALVALPLLACGRGAARAPAQTPGSAQPTTGQYAVAFRELSFTDPSRGRTLAVSVWYPSASGAAGRGPFPIVLFSHGLTGLPGDYTALLDRWAGAGYVVVAPTYPNTSRKAAKVQAQDVVNQPADASFVLTSVLGQASRSGDPFFGVLDSAHVAAAGHSLGGITTVGLFSTCCHDARLTAGVVLAGNSLGFGDQPLRPGQPVLFEHGTNDHIVPYQSGRHTYESMPGPKAFVTFDGEGHFDPYLKATDRSFGVDVATTLDFFRWTLRGDRSGLAALQRDGEVSGVARLENHLSGS
jgi:dienelactone hydrolase